MPLIIKDEKRFEEVSINNHIGICVGVWDLGHQVSEYKGEKSVKRKIVIRWEVNEDIESEGPYKGKKKTINGYYTHSLGSLSNLRKMLTSWLGGLTDQDVKNGFDVESLVGRSGMVNVVLSEKGTPKVGSVTKLPQGLQVFEPDTLKDFGEEPPEWILKQRVKNAEELTASGLSS